MKKPTLKKPKPADKPESRITNETVAEHREKILAGGRRFKYPRQYARHKLVFNAIIIGFSALVILVAITWWQLYSVQTTSAFFYRLTRIVPVPVASVDGSQVRYSDYLVILRSSLHYLERIENVNLSSEDGQRQIDLKKRESLDIAIADTYAAKVAQDKGLKISDSYIDEIIEASRNPVNGKVSQTVYDASVENQLGLLPDESRRLIYKQAVRQEAAYAVDTKAAASKDAAEKLIKTSSQPSLEAVTAGLKDKGYNIQVGASGLVPKTNNDGGLTQAALKLKPKQLSPVMRSTSGDGYYIVQLLKSTDAQASYAYIRIPLTMFDEQLKALKKNNKISEYIDVDKVETEIRK